MSFMGNSKHPTVFQVYSGVNVDSGQPVAIKAESMSAKVGCFRLLQV